MVIDKTSGIWEKGVSELDDIAYHLYCQYSKKYHDENYRSIDEDVVLLNQKSFMFWAKQNEKTCRESLDIFYEKARHYICRSHRSIVTGVQGAGTPEA